jgi:hypothetical protein
MRSSAVAPGTFDGMRTTKITSAAVVAVASALLLTGCHAAATGGAQNLDPVGKAPGSQDQRVNPAQRNGSKCPVASTGVVEKINESLGTHDDIDFADTWKTTGGWYIAGSVAPTAGQDDPNEDEVAVWVTTTNPTLAAGKDFSGTIYAVNRPARNGSSAPNAPAGFITASKDAQTVVSCIIEDVDH